MTEVAYVVFSAIAQLEREEISEWLEIHEQQPADGCSTIAMWTPSHREAVAAALKGFAMSQCDPLEALTSFGRWSHRLAVYLCCASARLAISVVSSKKEADADPIVSKMSARALDAVSSAERWVRGAESYVDVNRRILAIGSGSASISGEPARAYDAVESARMASQSIAKRLWRWSSVTFAAWAIADGDLWPEAMVSAKLRLCRCFADSVSDALDAAEQGFSAAAC